MSSKQIWDDLPFKQKQALKAAYVGKKITHFPGGREAGDNELVWADYRALETKALLFDGKITRDGIVIYEAGNPPAAREPSTEYDNLTADELLDVVRKTWIDYDLKSAIETAPPNDDYIAAHIIDVAVYATPAIPQPPAELAEARERIRELEAENAGINENYSDMCKTLQATATEFDDGKYAGRELDKVIVDLLREARLRTAELEAAIEDARQSLSNYTHAGAQTMPDILHADSILADALKGGQ